MASHRISSKLFMLKEWLTVPEAAKYLTTIFGEEVTEADVLRLALDRHLKLSVYFVNHTYARSGGKFLLFEEWKKKFCRDITEEELKPVVMPDKTLSLYSSDSPTIFPTKHTKAIDEPDEVRLIGVENFIAEGEEFSGWLSAGKTTLFSRMADSIFTFAEKQSHKYGGRVPPSSESFKGQPRSISGIWDLPLIGGERIDIEHEFQQLTGGPETTLISIDGTFVESQTGEVWQLQEKHDKEYLERVYGEEGIKKSIAYYEEFLSKKIENNEIDKQESKKLLEQRKENISKKRNYSDDFYPAGGLPTDSVLVVRTSSLLDLQERLTEEPTISQKTNPKVEKSNLHIIGAMLQIIMDNKEFNSEEELRKFIDEKYKGFAGCAERTLAGRFAEAKKLLAE